MPAPDPHRPDGRRIETEIRTSASPEEVWRAWTDPDAISRWFTDEARGEAKAGGTLVWSFRGFGEVSYQVIASDPPRRLVVGGDIPGRGPFALEILIRRSGRSTLVRLVNSGFLEGSAWDEEYEGVRSGWSASLALLKHCLEQRMTMPRHAVLITRPASVGASELYRYFSEPDRLATWLTRHGGLGQEGDPVALVLRDSMHLSGSILAATGREKAVAWDEEAGTVVELKGFASATSRMVGIRLTTWGPDRDRLSRLEPFFTAAVERLAAQFG
jgi:uncharacterized protein YndB with AHSA1/START domain